MDGETESRKSLDKCTIQHISTILVHPVCAFKNVHDLSVSQLCKRIV